MVAQSIGTLPLRTRLQNTHVFGLQHLASAIDREAQLVLSGLAFDIQSRSMASATNWEAKLVLIDPAFDI